MMVVSRRPYGVSFDEYVDGVFPTFTRRERKSQIVYSYLLKYGMIAGFCAFLHGCWLTYTEPRWSYLINVGQWLIISCFVILRSSFLYRFKRIRENFGTEVAISDEAITFYAEVGDRELRRHEWADIAEYAFSPAACVFRTNNPEHVPIVLPLRLLETDERIALWHCVTTSVHTAERR